VSLVGLQPRLGNPSSLPSAWPIVTCEGPVSIDLGAEPMRLLPQKPSHTDGDLVVHLPSANVLVMGAPWETAKPAMPLGARNSGVDPGRSGADMCPPCSTRHSRPLAHARHRCLALQSFAPAVKGFSTKPVAAAEPRVVRIMSMRARSAAGTCRWPG
jgi:hypothetical protein